MRETSMKYSSTVSGHFSLAFLGGLLTWCGLQSVMGVETKISFNRDIRPILSEHCYACHGPDEGQRKAGLRFDLEEEALIKLKSGHRAIVPGDRSTSHLVHRITATDPDEVMPPPEHDKPLNESQKQLLQAWIEQGAQWEGHWAYIRPQRPELPETSDTTWARNPIDQFIKAKHDALGLSTNEEASKETLIRRASLDLTGLPPSVEEIDAFLEDDSEAAYDGLIDRLLDSDHYGERQAQFWLDLARYGETQGFHHDRHRDMWHWRDWVIQAYNDNKPFDEFTIEQLAGDQLPDPSNDQLVATGFHRNEMTTSEGGALPEEYSVKYVVGRVDTTARVWLGTSLACAECHDHKYDPITQKEYYQFFAYFNNVPEDGLDRGMNPRPRVSLSSKAEDQKLAELNQQLDALTLAHRNIVEPANREYDEAQEEWAAQLIRHGVEEWTPIIPFETKSRNGSRFHLENDGTVKVSGTVSEKDDYSLMLHTTLTNITAIRLEAIPDEDSPHEKAGRSPEGDFVLTRLQVQTRPASNPERLKATPDLMLHSWRVIGPFPEETNPLDHPYGPESNLDFEARFSPDDLKWSPSFPTLEQALKESKPSKGVYYISGSIRCDHPTEGRLTLDTPHPHRLWANWKQIETEGDESKSKDAALPLRKGDNPFLLKLHALVSEPIPLAIRVSDPSQAFVDHKIKTAAASRERSRYGVQGTLDEKIETGWSVWGDGKIGTHREYAWFQFEQPLGHPAGTAIAVKLSFNSPLKGRLLGRFRLALSNSDGLTKFVGLPQNIRTELVHLADERNAEPASSLSVYYREQFVSEAKQLKKLMDAKRSERDRYRNDLPVAMVMGERDKKKDTFLLVRGEYNNPSEKVEPGVPLALFPEQTQIEPNRLALAKWLVDPDHPLTSRVIVNHYWQQFFGTGIVKTSEDFGSQGEWPSHPALLDWLAREFVESGWNIKHIHKLILTSSTYRQSARVSSRQLELDPGNRYLTRFPRLRLEAEGIRDMAMAVSGLLDRRIGGESIYPYQPPGLWEQVAFQGTRKWEQSSGEDNYRRGLYVYWRRSVPYASFVTFDAPSRETCTVKRPRTNTPLQALVLMNDPVYVEAARAFGLRIMKEGGEKLDQRVQFAFRTALGRPPSDVELTNIRQAFLVELSHFTTDRPAANQLIHVGASDPPLDTDICELAAWTIIGNILLNLDETITKG